MMRILQAYRPRLLPLQMEEREFSRGSPLGTPSFLRHLYYLHLKVDRTIYLSIRDG
jgi:hypothetical protein